MGINGTTLILAIIGHLIGDYLLQNDWMALNKKQSSFPYNHGWSPFSFRQKITSCFRWLSIPCFMHCFLWTLAVCFFSGWHSLAVITILFWSHYIQDRTQIVRFWMTKINRQQKFTEPPMAPWSLVVVDNVWHIVTLWAVWRFLV